MDKLIRQLHEWSVAADPEGFIIPDYGQIEVTEPGLGRYLISRLNLRAFGKWVGLVPKGPDQVLSPLQQQSRITPQLSDKVKQVRDYRNWIAHGKREPRDSTIVNLDAKEAFERLEEFLETLSIAVENEREESELDERERPTTDPT